MPAKTKTKKKKITTSVSKAKIAKKILKTSMLQLKKRKVQLAGLKKSLAEMMVEDSGKGLENIGKPAVPVNVFNQARAVKNFKKLEEFIDIFIPGLSAKDLAVLAAEHAKANWNIIKIGKDPDFQSSIFILLDEIDKKDGAVKFFNAHLKKENPSLITFREHTGYVIPATAGTFQNHVTTFKTELGLNRSKKQPLYGHFRDKPFKI